MANIITRAYRTSFPKIYEKQFIINTYKSLIIEQDENCAHKYVTSFDVLKNKTLILNLLQTATICVLC